MQIQPYVFFDGRCEESLEFYKKAIGAKVVMLMRFKESPDSHAVAPQMGDKIMHARFEVGESVVLASDGHATGNPKFDGFSLSLTVGNDAEAERMFNGLVEGGQATMPLTKTFFSSKFGMLKDKFGVMWMVYVGQ